MVLTYAPRVVELALGDGDAVLAPTHNGIVDMQTNRVDAGGDLSGYGHVHVCLPGMSCRGCDLTPAPEPWKVWGATPVPLHRVGPR